MYEQAQDDINATPDNDLYKGAYDPYDFVKSRIARDGCPDEISRSQGAEEDDNNSNEEGYWDREDYESDEYYSESSDAYQGGYNSETEEDLDLDRISLGEGSDSGEELY